MLKKLKQLVKKTIFSNSGNQIEKTKCQSTVNFPGGVTPIDQTIEDDIFIVGFPKSGNTLMQHIVAHLYYGLNEKGSRTIINLLTPDVYANKYYFRFNDVCFFKSHERPQPRYKKVIYVMRDGREALLSYYHMVKNMGQDISMEDLYDGKIPIYGGLWHEHIAAWEENPFKAEVLWVKYEDLKNDKLKEIQRICEFLNIKRSEEALEQVVSLTSLEHMKKLEKRPDWAKMKHNVSFNKGSFVRKGEVDSFKKEVPDRLIKIFESSNSIVLNKYY